MIPTVEARYVPPFCFMIYSTIWGYLRNLLQACLRIRRGFWRRAAQIPELSEMTPLPLSYSNPVRQDTRY